VKNTAVWACTFANYTTVSGQQINCEFWKWQFYKITMAEMWKRRWLWKSPGIGLKQRSTCLLL